MRRLTLTTSAGPMEYTIARRPRVTRRLHMELDDNGGLVVVAPRHWPVAYIDATLSQNTSRVERFLTRARKQQFEAPRFACGELHYYLGKRYPLHIGLPAGGRSGVSFNGEEIRVLASAPDPDRIRRALESWYAKQAREVLGVRLRKVANRAWWARDADIPLKLRKMKRTWGNCSSKGVIKLNTHLVKAPLQLVDSVIAHELCHLREMNHGKAFYALLQNLNPNWREDRRRLRSEGGVYLL